MLHFLKKIFWRALYVMMDRFFLFFIYGVKWIEWFYFIIFMCFAFSFVLQNFFRSSDFFFFFSNFQFFLHFTFLFRYLGGEYRTIYFIFRSFLVYLFTLGNKTYSLSNSNWLCEEHFLLFFKIKKISQMKGRETVKASLEIYFVSFFLVLKCSIIRSRMLKRRKFYYSILSSS